MPFVSVTAEIDDYDLIMTFMWPQGSKCDLGWPFRIHQNNCHIELLNLSYYKIDCSTPIRNNKKKPVKYMDVPSIWRMLLRYGG